MAIHFVSEAAGEYASVLDVYRQIRQSLGNRFRGAVMEILERIEANPESFPIFRSNYRWGRVRRFPCVLYFRMMPDGDLIVMPVAHERRREGYWLRRKWWS